MLDRAGRLQLPRDYVDALELERRVRLELEDDHIGVWPDKPRDANGAVTLRVKMGTHAMSDTSDIERWRPKGRDAERATFTTPDRDESDASPLWRRQDNRPHDLYKPIVEVEALLRDTPSATRSCTPCAA